MHPEIFQDFNKRIGEISSKGLFTYSGEMNPEIQELIDELNRAADELLNEDGKMSEAKYRVGEFIRWKRDVKSQSFFDKSIAEESLIDKIILWEDEASEAYEIEKITVEMVDGVVMPVYYGKSESGKEAVIPEDFSEFAY